MMASARPEVLRILAAASPEGKGLLKVRAD